MYFIQMKVTLEQCDQMAVLFIQYLASDKNEICPKASKINPSRFNYFSNTK